MKVPLSRNLDEVPVVKAGPFHMIVPVLSANQGNTSPLS